MSNPEIDRRCKSCGATIRKRAMFCPQCGHPTNQKDELAETIGLSLPETVQSPAEKADTIALDRTMTEAVLAGTVEQDQAKTEPLTASRIVYASDDEPQGRVEKLRKASSVVIEQAHYDPSLRFILVTAGLFILFLLLLILSKLVR